MNIDEVTAKIARDVQALLDHKEAVGKLVVTPAIETFNSNDSDEKSLWIVGRKDEYCITFDEASQDYGLAFRNILSEMVYLGPDGSIADAYNTLISREEADEEPVRKSFKPSNHRRRG